MHSESARVIVLLAHYNDNERLKKAIESIREDVPVDVLIVDDGSNIRPDETELKALLKKGKLTLSVLEQNQGSEMARNHGMRIIDKLDYEFIAAMDSDDLNKPGRFAKQIAYLDKNKDVMLLGSWADCIDVDGNFLYTHKYPTSDREIRKKMYFNSMFVHASLMFRKEILKTTGFYPEQYKWAEDYALAFKAMRHFKIENYPEALICYRVHVAGISTMYRRAQVVSRIRIIRDNFYFGFYPIFGLIRNIPLLFISRETLTPIKKFLRR